MIVLVWVLVAVAAWALLLAAAERARAKQVHAHGYAMALADAARYLPADSFAGQVVRTLNEEADTDQLWDRYQSRLNLYRSKAESS